ncbi:MAG: ATP-binding protein, partial [Ktedonobacterales bacterium]
MPTSQQASQTISNFRSSYDAVAFDAGELGIAIAFHDLTNKAVFDEMLVRTQSLEALTRLAGGVAHDFNNLLAVVVGYCELLRTSALGDEELEMVGEISSSAAAAAALTNQLLTFGRRQMVSPCSVDVGEFVREKEGELRERVGPERSLVLKLSSAPCRVKIDPSQLEQMLTELIGNAVDATAPGGIVTIDVDIAAELPIPTLSPDDPYVLFFVSDDGCGMEEATLYRIFDPYFTTKDIGSGRGMGLAVVYGIVKQNRGYFLVDSTPGGGSRVGVYLPENGVRARRTPLAADRPLALLLEGDDTTRGMLALLLEEEGYQVLDAADGDGVELAWRATGGVAPDLLVADVQC